MTDLDSVREKLVNAVRILDHLGVWEANYGHVSCRLSDPQKICMLGHLHDETDVGMPLPDVGPEHMIVVDINTLEYEGSLEPPGEVFIHTEIYKAREDMNGVVHAHPELPVALSIAGQPVLPVHYYSGLFHPSVPIFDDHRIIDNPESAIEMVRVLADHLAVVLKGHGATTLGGTLEEAVIVMSALNICARLQYLAAQVGTPRPNDFAQPESRHFPHAYVQNVWNLYLNLAGKQKNRR